ncbi:MAG: outer membrane lipoprotein carrier protein LolA [Candidatus Cloacimonadota bacterium]|nr:MAG: outer membrane lipoprotein carrier protein LolA [Candidatus Cloacimonadota bacterium]
MKKLFLIIFTLSFGITIFSESTKELRERIEKSFSSIMTFSATFNEKIVPVIGETQSFKGTIDIARPCSLRMEITSPEKELILYDGEIAWLYLPGEQYCLKYRTGGEHSLSRIPGYILEPFENLIVDTLYNDTDFIFLKLSSEKEDDFFKSIELKLSKDKILPSSLTFKDKAGNKTEYNFSNISVNSNKKINFTFTPPDGIEIIEK